MSEIEELSSLDEEFENYFNRIKNKDRLINRATRKLHGSSHGITVCKGPELCPFYHICPIAEMDEDGTLLQLDDREYPIGLPCLPETMFFRQCLANYIVSLDIDKFNIIEMKMAQELALVDLEKYRYRNILAAGDKRGQGRDGLMSEETVVFVGDTAHTVAKTEIHPLVDLLDRLDKRHNRLASKFLATRRDIMEMKSRIGGNTEQNRLTQQLAQLNSAIEKLSKDNLLVEKAPTDVFDD